MSGALLGTKDRAGVCSADPARENPSMTAKETIGKEGNGRPWNNPETLRRLYHGEKLTQREMADELGCSQTTISDAFQRHSITAREHYRHTPASFNTIPRGHEVWQARGNGAERMIFVHRLLAVSEFGFEAVRGMDVHHKNGVPWDNRPENIELLTASEHAHRHESPKLDWMDVVRVKELYRNGEVSQKTIGKIFGVSQRIVSDVVLEKRTYTTDDLSVDENRSGC